MKKGKFGLSLSAIGVIAFAFVVFRQPTAVLLVCGFALLAEKDKWLNRQVLQALFLTIAYFLAELVLNLIFGGLAQFFGWVKLYGASSAMNTVNSIFGSILYLALIVFSVLAVINLLREKDANLPLISKMAAGDFKSSAKAKSKAAAPAQASYPGDAMQYQTQYTPAQPARPEQAAAPVQTQYTPPVQPTQPAQPEQAPEPVQTQSAVPQPAEPVAAQPIPTQAAPSDQVPANAAQAADPSAARVCPACSAPLRENAIYCSECGTKVE